MNGDFFSLIIFEFNLLVSFRHYNRLFAINFKAVFNMAFYYFFCTESLKTITAKCFHDIKYDYACMYENF